MKLLLYLSDFIVPVTILGIVAYGVFNKVNVYDDFIKGAKSGFFTVIKIMPTLIGLMVAVGILRASGFLDFLSEIIGKMTAYVGLVLDIFKEYGTDSRIGLIASIMMSCTETIFYTMSVYFMAAKVRKTRYTLAGALAATLAGIMASVWLATN